MKRMIKTLLISALCICMLLAATPNLGSPVFAAEIVDSGRCGENLTWTLDSNGLLTIKGTGEMTNFKYPQGVLDHGLLDDPDINPESPWLLNNNVKSLLIEEGITTIGNYSFMGCMELTSAQLPSTLTCIGIEAFRFCVNLTEITIPAYVDLIDRSAFSNCENLSTIEFGNKITKIKWNAFSGTAWENAQPDGLIYAGSVAYKYKGEIPDNTRLVLKSDTLGIAEYAFEEQPGLISVEIPNSVKVIGKYAFFGCEKLSDISIPENIIYIGPDAFFRTAWLNEKPNGLVYAGKVAYSYKGDMPENSEIIIRDGTLSITGYTFRGCKNMVSISIPSSIVFIGSYAFDSCDSLKKVFITDLSSWCRIEFEDFLAQPLEQGATLYLNENAVTDLVLPNEVTCIRQYAFRGYQSLTSVSIPDSVTNIGAWAFSFCTNLTSVIIPDSVTSIRDGAFYSCWSLASVKVPNNITNIDDEVFGHCENLKSITIPDSVTNIGRYTFYSCTSLTDVYYMGSETQWKQLEIADENDHLLNATIHYHTHTPGQPVETVLKTATCGEAGEKKLTVTCTVCGAVVSETTETIPATGVHTFGDWTVKVPATVDAEGEETRTCSVCGATESRAIPKQEKPDEPAPAIDTDTLQEADGAIYAAPEQTTAALLAAAGEGAALTNADGSPAAPDALLSTGMILTKADGTQETVIVKGDNDGDGRITASDARLALRCAVGLETFEPGSAQFIASNVDDDDKITASDARLILRAAVGLEALKLR